MLDQCILPELGIRHSSLNESFLKRSYGRGCGLVITLRRRHLEQTLGRRVCAHWEVRLTTSEQLPLKAAGRSSGNMSAAAFFVSALAVAPSAQVKGSKAIAFSQVHPGKCASQFCTTSGSRSITTWAP